MVLAVLAGSISGLLASAISKSPSVAPLIMILLIIPQIVLSGSLVPLSENVTAVASTRWAFQDFAGLTGMGSDVASDPCWQLTKDERDLMNGLRDLRDTGVCLPPEDLAACRIDGYRAPLKPNRMRLSRTACPLFSDLRTRR